MSKARLAPVLFGAALLAVCGCHSTRNQQVRSPRPHVIAEASLAPMSGFAALGKVRFTQDDDSTMVGIDLSDVTPGRHGLSVHEGGACGTSGSNARSAIAGGDLGVAQVNGDKTFHSNLDNSKLYLSGEPSIIGRTVVLHVEEDLSSAALACGVIVRVAP